MVQIHTSRTLWIGSDDMSKKPVKKSDSEKGWMKKRRDNRRMIAPEYHLIVTEGTKTEPNYFGKLKEEINSRYRDRISIEIAGMAKTKQLPHIEKCDEFIENVEIFLSDAEECE